MTAKKKRGRAPKEKGPCGGGRISSSLRSSSMLTPPHCSLVRWLRIWPRACRVGAYCRRGRSAALVGALTAVTAVTCSELLCGCSSFMRLWLSESRPHKCDRNRRASFCVGRLWRPRDPSDFELPCDKPCKASLLIERMRKAGCKAGFSHKRFTYFRLKKAFMPGYSATSSSSSSMRSSWLYLATRSVRLGAPVLIWPALTATAMSAMVASSVSPER